MAVTDKSIYKFINRTIRSSGEAPSLSEIASEFGLATPAHVRARLNRMEKQGCIRREAGRHRAIELIKAPDDNYISDLRRTRHGIDLSRVPTKRLAAELLRRVSGLTK